MVARFKIFYLDHAIGSRRFGIGVLTGHASGNGLLHLVEPAHGDCEVVTTTPGFSTEPAEAKAWMQCRVAGQPQPTWSDGSEGAHWGDETVWRAQDCRWWPRQGAVSDSHGNIFLPTLGQPRTTTPAIAELEDTQRKWLRNISLHRYRHRPKALAGSVFMSFGGTFNYGHFLLDCLSSLVLLDEANQLKSLPPLAPPLRPWHRQAIRLAVGDVKIIEIRQPIAILTQAAFASPMDHFLHHPNYVLCRLRSRILSRTSQTLGRTKLYLTRRGWSMRVMIDEQELQEALEARGFKTIHLENFSVSSQVKLMRSADVIVGATGAALANTLFCGPEAKIFEIQPDGFHSQWVRSLRQICGGEWFGWFVPAPVDPREAPWLARKRRGFRFAYKTHVAEFLNFLDERMHA